MLDSNIFQCELGHEAQSTLRSYILRFGDTDFDILLFSNISLSEKII